MMKMELKQRLSVTGGNVKLQWKPDFGARWAAALNVDFEMYGKDHSTNTPIYDGKICRILGSQSARALFSTS